MAKLAPTKFMLQLKDNLKEKRGISEATANKYLSQLVLLNEKNTFQNLGFLKRDKERIVDYLKEKELSTENGYLASIVSSLSLYKDQHLYKTIYSFYSNKLNEQIDKDKGIDRTHTSEKESDNWLTWDDVEKKHAELEKEVNKFKGDKSITAKNFEILVDYLVLSLYTLQAPRRNQDYMDAYILVRDTKSEDLEPEIKNYIDIPNERFIFNVYKTKKFYGVQTEPINEKMMEVLKIWLKFHPVLNGTSSGKKVREVKLFVNSQGTPQTVVNFITLRLNKIFKRKIGSTQMRKIYITSKLGSEYLELQREAESMGHSMNIVQTNYLKKDKIDKE
jgi:hypothetical protein